MRTHTETIRKTPFLKREAVLLNITRSPFTGLILAILITGLFAAFNVWDHLSLKAWFGLIIITWLAAENGGNDVSKGVAPLVASGAVREFGALLYGSIVTAIGGIFSIYFSMKLLKLFTSGIIGANYTVTTMMAIAMAGGATLWVALATHLSLPVSTTHAIVGSVVLVGCLVYGLPSVEWSSLLNKVAAPLLFSPLVGLGFAFGLMLLVRHISISKAVGKSLTWLSSGAVCFVRAVNDTPKIAGIATLVAFVTLDNISEDKLIPLFVLITLGMSLGSMVKGLMITKLLARNVTKLDSQSSLSSILATTVLVLFSSKWGLPVSTTHVSTSAIIGAGMSQGKNTVNWKVIRDIVLSWVITLPAAGILGILVYTVFLLAR